MSKKKTLINENSVRRFMTLASIGSLTENYFENYTDLNEEEEELEVDAELETDVEPEGELDLGEPEGEPELDPGAPADEATVADLVDAIADAVTSATGIPVAVEGGGEDVPETDMDAEPELEPEPEADLAPEDGAEEEEALMQELESSNIQVFDNDALVAEITKRVAKRLLREKIKPSSK